MLVEIDLNSANMLCQVYISRSEWNEGVKLLQIIERGTSFSGRIVCSLW